jgi:hypothetical protein
MNLGICVVIVIISLSILAFLLDCFLTAKYRENPKYIEYFDKPVAHAIPFIIIIEKREKEKRETK